MRAPSLPETLLVLRIDGDEGGTRDGLALGYALAGAQLRELALAGRVTIDPQRVAIVDATPTGDPQLDELLAKIASTSDSPRRPGHWVMKRRSAGVAIYARRLLSAGVLRRRRTRILGIVPRTTFPMVDDRWRDGAIEQIRAALADPSPPQERTAALIALVWVTGGAARLIDDREQHARAAQIASDDVVAMAVRRAIEAVAATAGAGSTSAG